jgi:hypothetical protein
MSPTITKDAMPTFTVQPYRACQSHDDGGFITTGIAFPGLGGGPAPAALTIEVNSVTEVLRYLETAATTLPYPTEEGLDFDGVNSVGYSFAVRPTGKWPSGYKKFLSSGIYYPNAVR